MYDLFILYLDIAEILIIFLNNYVCQLSYDINNLLEVALILM